MENEIKETLIYREKEKENQFNLSFKWILAISIALTGLLSLGGIIFLVIGISNHIWITSGTNIFLNQSLFYICIIICFVALVSIAAIKKPFSKILVWCSMAIGILFILASVTFPHIPGYTTSSFDIISNGQFTLIDGTIFIIGILGILFSKIIQYGFIYQSKLDMTI